MVQGWLGCADGECRPELWSMKATGADALPVSTAAAPLPRHRPSPQGGPQAKLNLTWHRAILSARSDKFAERWMEEESRHTRVRTHIRQVGRGAVGPLVCEGRGC